jgi:hypothetical protein
MSTSSTIADWRRQANLSRVVSRLFSRSMASRSIHHRNALLEGERGDVWLSPLVFQCLGHAGEG